MKLKVFKPQIVDKSIKCTIQKSGRLGFSIEAIKKLNLSGNSSIKIGTNSEDETDENLYIIVQEIVDEESFKLYKAGDYYYIDTRILFDTLRFDYKNNTIMFDIVDFESDETKLYKLIKREVPKTKNKKVDE
jgi:hypothetical protein